MRWCNRRSCLIYIVAEVDNARSSSVPMLPFMFYPLSELAQISSYLLAILLPIYQRPLRVSFTFHFFILHWTGSASSFFLNLF